MDQKKIGKLIAECRKNKKLTQVELGDKLGVTDKSVSKWENGICLPDVSLYKELCDILGITLNDFFAGEIILEEKFKEVADNNLLVALENSTFTLKERIKYYKKKWLKEHIFKIFLGIAIWIAAILVFKFNNAEHLIGWFAGLIAVLIYSVLYNEMMIYVEKRAYKEIEK